MSGDDRLPHGYTNLTRRVEGGAVVEKTFVGSDAKARFEREELSLGIATSVLPVPRVVGTDEARCLLRLEWIRGTPGQDVINDGFAREVLEASGSLLARLQVELSPLLVPRLQGNGSVVVHGDYGPQNLLFDANDRNVSALLDWEFARTGDPVEDLAWAEWIVRMHHSTATDALDALFIGYGARPGWSERQSAMVAQCEMFRRRCEVEGWVEADATWRGRLQVTERWDD